MSVSHKSTAAVSYDEDEVHNNSHRDVTGQDVRAVIDSSTPLSPYVESDIISIDVGSSATRFRVHSLMLRKCPPLFALASKDRPVSLPELDAGPAHTLIHYLYTGTFETRLRHAPVGNFIHSTCVYCAAIQYQLPNLAALSKGKIIDVGENLPVLDILRVARDYAFSLLPESDTWYSAYLEDVIEKAMSKDPEPFRKPDFITNVEGNSRLLQIIWKTVMSNHASISAPSSVGRTQESDAETPLAESLLTDSEVPPQDSLHQLPSPTDSAVNSPPISKEAETSNEPEPLNLSSSVPVKPRSSVQAPSNSTEPKAQLKTASNDDLILPAIEPTTTTTEPATALKIVATPAKEVKKPEHIRADSVVEEDAVVPDSSFELAKRGSVGEVVTAASSGNSDAGKKNKKNKKKGRSGTTF